MLFEVTGSPSAEAPDPGRGRPRLRTANREQVVFRAAPLDDLIPWIIPRGSSGTLSKGST